MTSSERPLIGIVDALGGPVDLAAYESRDGYVGARRALSSMTSEEVNRIVKDANLRAGAAPGSPQG